MRPARLFIVCGRPGTGTTARANELAERFAAVRLSVDEWMERLGVDVRDEVTRTHAETILGELVTDVLRIGTNVVVEWGTRTRSERDRLRARASATGALVHLDFLDSWSGVIAPPDADELAEYDPMPPVRAGDQPGMPAYPYGTWSP